MNVGRGNEPWEGKQAVGGRRVTSYNHTMDTQKEAVSEPSRLIEDFLVGVSARRDARTFLTSYQRDPRRRPREGVLTPESFVPR